MFAVVRTGGKQYRVALGDKIVVEKVAGETGQRIDITDVLLAGEGSELKSVKGLTVGAEIIAQAKADKVTVFKKRRRHNYRRKAGHRQQHTILRIVAIGDQKAEKKAAPKAEKAAAPKAEKPAKTPAASESTKTPQVDAPATENPAPDDQSKANPDKPKTAAPKKAAADKAPAKKATAKPAAKPAGAKPAAKASTKNAAPAKGAAGKATKSKPTKAK